MAKYKFNYQQTLESATQDHAGDRGHLCSLQWYDNYTGALITG